MSENNNLSKNALLTKLKEISSLYDDVLDVKTEMDEYAPEDNYERERVLPVFPGEYTSEEERNVWATSLDHSLDDATEIVEAAHKNFYAPKKPEPLKTREFQAPTKTSNFATDNKGCLTPIIIMGLVFLLANAIVGDGKDITCLVVVALCSILLAAFVVMIISAKMKDKEKLEQAKIEYNKSVLETKNQYENDLAKFEKDSLAYEASLNEFLKQYAEWRMEYIAHLKEEEAISERLESDRVEGVNKLYDEKYIPAKNRLDECNDIISDEYLPVIDDIINLLESGRADNLKEAVNLYEDIVFREKQLQLEREQEAQRRYEEDLRRQDEERRYQEEKEFRERQERERKREFEARERAEQQRHREEMALRERQERERERQERERARRDELNSARIEREQKEKQWQAAKKQCQSCAHVGKCNMSVYNNTPTCTGFTPR